MSKSIPRMHQVPGYKELKPQKILELCDFLAPIMNDIHKTSYSDRFWATLLKDYAKTCIDRELLLSDQILQSRPAILPINGWEIPTRKDRWWTRIRNVALVAFKKNSFDKVNRILKENDNICVGIRGEEFERFGLGKYCPSYNGMSSFFLDSGLRKKLKIIAEREHSTFRKNVILQLPRYYVEDIKKNISRIALHEPQKKIFHAEHLSGMMDLIISLYVEHGAKYYRYQLGCNFGEIKSSTTPVTYIDIDKFRTFGWKIHEKDEPHVAYRLEQFSRSYETFSSKITHDLCIVYNRMTRKSKIERYEEVSNEIFSKLNFQRYSKVLLRPRGTTRKLDNSGELAFLNPPSNVTIGKGKRPMHEIVKASRIMVHLNIPSTNFLECVYINHPVVAILTATDPTEIIKPYYQFFLDQKVMHKDVHSLIDHLNSVDLETWWRSVITHSKYNEFKYLFARKVETEKNIN